MSGHTARDDGPELTLGVVWCLLPDEITDYAHLEQHDRMLYQQLMNIVRANQRSVASVKKKGVLPPHTVFFDEPLTWQAKARRAERVARRDRWLRKALATTEACDVVFLDPDNGLEVPTVGPYSKDGPKYVFYQDLRPYLDRSQSLIIYQHANRERPVADQIHARLRQLADIAGNHDRPFGACFKNKVAFLVLPWREHAHVLQERAHGFLRGWGRDFTLCTL